MTRTIVLLIALTLSSCQVPLRDAQGAERTSDDWFKLVVELDQADEFFDRVDRKFIRYMINILSKDETGIPTPHQQKWLMNMKQRLDAKK